MDRRRFLASAAALSVAPTAGCVGSVSDALGGPPPHPRRVAVAAVERLPEEFAFEIDAHLPTPTVTDRHPATLVLTATNAGPRRKLSVGTDGCRPFNRSRGRSDDGGSWLYHARGEPTDRVEGRWTFDPDGDVGYAAYGCAMREWAAGESRTFVYSVWDDFRTEGYYEPGRYRWELPVRVAPAGEDDGGEADATDATDATAEASETTEAAWALALRVSVPG